MLHRGCDIPQPRTSSHLISHHPTPSTKLQRFSPITTYTKTPMASMQIPTLTHSTINPMESTTIDTTSWQMTPLTQCPGVFPLLMIPGDMIQSCDLRGSSLPGQMICTNLESSTYRHMDPCKWKIRSVHKYFSFEKKNFKII